MLAAGFAARGGAVGAVLAPRHVALGMPQRPSRKINQRNPPFWYVGAGPKLMPPRGGAGEPRADASDAGDTARQFTFAFQDGVRRDVRTSRRKAIANYIDTWAGADVVAERREMDTLRCWVTFTTARPVRIEVAEQFVSECPHYVRGTLAAV